MSSILNDIKKMLGLDSEYKVFDLDVMIHINSAFMTLNELGVGPEKGFMISGVENEWNEFLPEGIQLEGVKTYIYLRVKLLFDPPTNSFLVDAIEKQIKELEWRLNVKAESSEESVPSLDDSSNFEEYDGEYSLKPSFEDQVLETKDKILRSDVTITKIQISETPNESEGLTLEI